VKTLTRLIRSLAHDRSGSILVEFSLAMPLLAVIMLGGLEISRYVLLNQKLDRVAGSIGDLVSQAETISVTDLTSLFDATPFVVSPFALAGQGVVFVSSVSASDGDPPLVNWQHSGAGSLAATSMVGAPGA
jgi:Flp pilus assembly protein TadG